MRLRRALDITQTLSNTQVNKDICFDSFKTEKIYNNP